MDPEEREIEKLMHNYRIVMSLVPNNSSTITVDDRRQIRAAMHEIKLKTMIMIGVAKDLKPKANTTERKMTTTAINNKQRTQRSYSTAVKTGQTKVIAQTEATQQTQKQQHKFKKITRKWFGSLQCNSYFFVFLTLLYIEAYSVSESLPNISSCLLLRTTSNVIT
ncbi:hypothetical protein RN001_010492 [Aquatica leii]|uniref:Uncharacterized protein n=1 Tax=Aquatica leii TaxID=1421715 RepID=A0AAN7PA09_9COLE|nr:hypothetical protein RN001_010492 [Aquatica leii]